MKFFQATSIKAFLTQQWLAIILISLGTFLRFHHLPEKGILFGDSGHDLLVAAKAVETNTLPVLGIPSSVPRFHQGPLTIWLSMAIYTIVGYEPHWYFWTFAFIGCLAMIALYEFCLVWLNRKIGLLALTLLAVSPLAIAHSRMVYHTVPIAFFTVLVLWATARLFEHKNFAWPIAVLASALLFQHELSLFPVFLALPVAWWWGGLRKGLSWQKAWQVSIRDLIWSGAALTLGLLPQIISELRDQSHQLSGFAVWLGYRMASFLLPTSAHFGANTLLQSLGRFSSYGSQVFLVPGFSWFAWVCLGGVLAYAALGWLQIGRKVTTWSAGVTATVLITGFITAGYLVHGAPSEAYFPVYVVLLPLMLAIGLAAHSKISQRFSYMVVAGLAITATLGVWHNDFFVDSATAWSYGPSLSTQQKVIDWMATQQPATPCLVGSHDAGASFESYFESYVWLAQTRHLTIQPTQNQSQADFLIKQTSTTQTSISFSNLGGSLRLPEQLSLPAVQVMTQ